MRGEIAFFVSNSNFAVIQSFGAEHGDRIANGAAKAHTGIQPGATVRY